MKKYAVGYIHFADNELYIEIVEADNAVQACFSHSMVDEECFPSAFPTIEEIKDQAFNMECMVNAKEII